MRTLTLGILAHVDAGKTSLTERLLHAAGVIDEIGSVDHGSTQTDTLALERQRGITIRSAVVSFAIDDVTVNLIDTPGHPDFIAEVERVLHVLDGVVLVVSAVEGVQPQTRVLMRTLRRLRIPTLLFVNKIDRGGARPDGVLRAIATKLDPAVIAMGAVHRAGTRQAGVTPYGAEDPDFLAGLVNLRADHDDGFVAAYVADESVASYQRLRDDLVARTRRALAHPVFFGSAITGAGTAALMAGIRELLPAGRGDARAPLSGSVFKVERGPAGEKVAYARLFAGTLRVRDRVRFGPPGGGAEAGPDAGRIGSGPAGSGEGKVTAVAVFDRGGAEPRDEAAAGGIAKLWGLHGVRVGDALGEPRPGAGSRHFAPPTLETVVSPCRPAERGALHTALTQLAEQDPLINLRQDGIRQEISVSLYGEVQKEVIAATLVGEYGIDVAFRESTAVCVERLTGTGAAMEHIKGPGNPFLATVGLRVRPAPVDSGVEFRLGVELGAMPLAFFLAVEDTVRETLGQGLYGWQIPDCVVTLTHSGYWPRQSHAHARFDKSMSSTGADFRSLTPLVLMAALRRAGTAVCAPVHRFHLDVPADSLGTVLPALARFGAVPDATVAGGASYRLEGLIPADRVHGLELRLPELTSGEGALDTAFDHYRPVPGAPPTRPRTDHNPLNRREYLLHVLRRV